MCVCVHVWLSPVWSNIEFLWKWVGAGGEGVLSRVILTLVGWRVGFVERRSKEGGEREREGVGGGGWVGVKYNYTCFQYRV